MNNSIADQFADFGAEAMWRDTFIWVTQHTVQIVVATVLGAVIALVLLGLKWLGKRLARRHADGNHWYHIIGKSLGKIRLWFVAAVVAQVVATYAHAPSDLAGTIYFLFVIAFTLQAAVFAREVVLGIIEFRASGHQGLGSALNIIRLLVTFALFSIAAILILSNLGVNVTGLIAGLGVGGIAIGLAAQGIFRDLFAALSILFDRPFVVGDTIKFGDVTGKVQTIGLKTTRVRSVEGEEVIMSNDKLLDQQIRNFHGIEQRRIVLSLPLHYANAAAKFAEIPDALKAVVADISDSSFDHALLTEFKDNAVTLELMLHSTKGAADVRDRVRHEAMCATLAWLEREGIGLSYQSTDMPRSKADIVERK
ncbi:mechanosensitive ion channel family protein [Sphingomonas sp. SUN039]|uniref:mechanosensitive ion channel family protein n=1 Tax=Sphingomonas sp. SUN039 TaxID=2937787 RepID=UPI002164702B|nr:mechanosensitive ion channel family protein [Sphingomonas sp. SUN039]UVO52735.1 mechanosensitive ion channel family protein [Sphingomonas sp. SUN039]